jgi:hypothetical protein
VLMANAADEMLAMAGERGWEHTGSNDEDGVAQIVETLLSSSPGTGSDSNLEGSGRKDKIAEWV